ncbi:MAG: hypothetical protein HYS87_00960 [Candidatus Colwellbacteria bacterium]|nr:hypothetical protein [Candidatus Colwellbacteria bacterium]
MEYFSGINWFAVFGVAAIGLAIRIIWKKDNGLAAAALALISSFVLATLIANLGVANPLKGAAFGALIWLGFVAPTRAQDLGLHLTTLVIMGLALTWWQ